MLLLFFFLLSGGHDLNIVANSYLFMTYSKMQFDCINQVLSHMPEIFVLKKENLLMCCRLPSSSMKIMCLI